MFSRSSSRSFISMLNRVSRSLLVSSLDMSFPRRALRPSIQMQYCEKQVAKCHWWTLVSGRSCQSPFADRAHTASLGPTQYRQDLSGIRAKVNWEVIVHFPKRPFDFYKGFTFKLPKII